MLHNINSSFTYTFLGIHLNFYMKWETHINKLSKQINSSIFALRCLSKFSSQEVLKLGYYGLIESRLRYGLIFWGFSFFQDFNRIFILQKRALRSCRELFQTSNIYTLTNLLIYHSAMFVFKNRNFFPSFNHIYSTRHATNIKCRHFKLNLFKNSIFYYGSKVFNWLPIEQHIKQSENHLVFKKELRRFLNENVFYSLEDALKTTVHIKAI